MAEDSRKLLVELAERVGIPTVLLFLLLWGAFTLLQPVSRAAVKHFEIQTDILSEMATDLKATRSVVEADKAEQKIKVLQGLHVIIKDNQHKLDGLYDLLNGSRQ